MSSSEPTKPRVLLVEDNALLALATQGLLEGLGYTVVGPAGTVKDGLALAINAEIDAAILDLNIIGGDSLPIAMALEARECPFLFVTGYSDAALDGRWRHVPMLSKPLFKADLQQGLRQLLASQLTQHEIASSEL